MVPLAALAGVTAYVGFSLLEWSTWRRLPRMRRVDAAAFLATAVAVLAANAIAAVAIGCLIQAAGNACRGRAWRRGCRPLSARSRPARPSPDRRPIAVAKSGPGSSRL